MALVAGLATGAQADDKLTLSANVALTTDYVFRGITQTASQPAVQGGFDATWKLFYAGVWASNLDFGGGPNGQDLASIEMDWYGGIRPTWQGLDFDIGAIYYTYPGAYDPGTEFNYVEIKTGVSHTFKDTLTLGITNYWTPEFSGEAGEGDALELGAAYAFTNKWFNFFSPSVSGALGWQWVDDLDDYTYWNVGLTLGFLDHWSADVRYWDTDSLVCPSHGVFSCDARVVGTIKAAF
jgi:uncharacterized protein (TIGR02001 family)